MVAALGLGAAAAAGFGCDGTRASNERGGQPGRLATPARLPQTATANCHSVKRKICILHPSQAKIDELPKENAMEISGR